MECLISYKGKVCVCVSEKEDDNNTRSTKVMQIESVCLNWTVQDGKLHNVWASTGMECASWSLSVFVASCEEGNATEMFLITRVPVISSIRQRFISLGPFSAEDWMGRRCPETPSRRLFWYILKINDDDFGGLLMRKRFRVQHSG